MEFAGEFETHLTVTLDDPDGVERLRMWADKHRIKFTHIVLSRGQSASQPMLTLPARGTLSTTRRAAAKAAAAMDAAGFVVSRIKIEATPSNEDVPASDDGASRQPADRYFEHHVKLLLAAGAAIEPIAAIAGPHGAHVSRNALRHRDDGKQERFVTQRCFGVGREAANASLHLLVDGLAQAGYEIIDVEREFVVYDSNLALDAGWIDL